MIQFFLIDGRWYWLSLEASEWVFGPFETKEEAKADELMRREKE